MKKIISTLAALALAVGYVGAQDLAEITEMYNSGAEAIAAGDKEGALKSFEQYASAASAYFFALRSTLAFCITTLGKSSFASARMSAFANFSATDMVVLILSIASVYLVSLTRLFAIDGQQTQAYKQLSNLFLKEAAADLKAKQYAKAVDAAVKVTEYDEKNSLAFQIAGQASQIQNKDNDAIKYFEKYLELAPTAKNATQIAFTVGALYQKAKNNAKAVEYFQKAVNDPALGDKAKALINALK